MEYLVSYSRWPFLVFAVYKGEKKMKQISDGSKRTLQVTKKERKKKGEND